MRRFRPWHVRTRLAVWFVALLAGVLLIYGVTASILQLVQLRAQLDRFAVQDFETVEGLLHFASDGKVHLHTDYHDHPYSAEMQERLMEVWSLNGELLYQSPGLPVAGLGGRPVAAEGLRGFSKKRIHFPDGTPVWVISKRHNIDGHPTVIRVGFSEANILTQLWQGLRGLIASLPLALALAGIGGYFLARRALSPLERMALRVRRIRAEDLAARLEVENPGDEHGLLAQTFNETLSRLEDSFAQLKQFTSDASHELRTPLTAIRSVGEVALRKQGNADQYRDVIGSMLEEAAKLSEMVDSLLTISRADCGQVQLRLRTISPLQFARDVAALMAALFEEKGQVLTVSGEETLRIEADEIVLRQVLTNLLDNASKYSPSDTKVSVCVALSDPETVSVDVTDNGPGIPKEHQAKIFNRFYRIDEGRSREAGGAGLGLAIARWGATAHGGTLELASPERGRCVFRVSLPRSGQNLSSDIVEPSLLTEQ